MKKNYPTVFAAAKKNYLKMMLVPALVVSLFAGVFGLFYSPSPLVTFGAALIGSILTSFAMIEIDMRSVAKNLGVEREEIFISKFGLGWSYKKSEDLREKFDSEFYHAVRCKEAEQKENK